MIKKAIKFVAAIAIVSFVTSGIHPASSNAASTAETLVLKAEANKVSLIRQTSIEYKADVKTQPWKEYNQAKNDYAKAQIAVAKLKGKEKENLTKRLNIVKTWIDRSAGYIDAISSGEKLLTLQKTMDKQLADGNIEEAAHTYHQLSYEIKKQAKILYRVYGQSTRQAMLNTYKTPAEASKAKALYPVSIQMELDRLEINFENEDDSSVNKNIVNIETWLNKITDPAMFNLLEDKYEKILDTNAPTVVGIE